MKITLIIAEKDANKELATMWYNSLRASLPSGVLGSTQVGDKCALMTTRKQEGKCYFVAPLVRELTANEVEQAIRSLDEKIEIDFKVEAQQSRVANNPEIEVELPKGPLNELCSNWAKRQHDTWMKEKTEQGWRYGTDVSKEEKTHPLLRPWADLPEEYRKVDTTQVEEMLKLLNDSGYILIRKAELAALKPKA